ncbi:hypothetical protein HYE59_00820 [Aggregatibacter actinomycetemcomitans]|uniref:hypothetical protein n=1 Tax=Aggregatibacter actinomycetemcomitans TaxID=714 RepID=UPI00197B19BE|nr:hypothetical protein [Aggregatibacter actinomycetemcomitans]MBN6076118.1 hypothetical protein [Aggregatibacter actinomycetemcomitans]
MVNVTKEILKLVGLILNGTESRENISKMASNLIEDIEANDLNIEPDVFSFLQYIEGYDMPDFEREYLFTLDDFKIEFNKIKNRF